MLKRGGYKRVFSPLFSYKSRYFFPLPHIFEQFIAELFDGVRNFKITSPEKGKRKADKQDR